MINKILNKFRSDDYEHEVIIDFEKKGQESLGLLQYCNAFEVLPNGICRTVDGGYMAMFKIKPTDVSSLTYGEQKNAIKQYFNAIKLYEKPFKIISENEVYNLSKNNEFLNNLYDKTNSPIIRQEIERHKKINERNEKVRKLNFFFFIFANTDEEIKQNVEEFKGTFFISKFLEFSEIKDNQEVENILFNLNNLGIKE